MTTMFRTHQFQTPEERRATAPQRKAFTQLFVAPSVPPWRHAALINPDDTVSSGEIADLAYAIVQAGGTVYHSARVEIDEEAAYHASRAMDVTGKPYDEAYWISYPDGFGVLLV